MPTIAQQLGISRDTGPTSAAIGKTAELDRLRACDRTSRAVRLVHLPHGHSAEMFSTALECALGALPEAARHTLTLDQGSETARHPLLAGHFEKEVFFAEAAIPWQRGTNENTGLLRQFFPKGKVLKWQTPELVFAHGPL
jgi:transposase, IS30 family